MTREEAIEFLGCIYMEVSTDEDKEAVDMAIEALKEQRPRGEWIPCTFTDKRTGETVNFTIGSVIMMTCSACNKEAFAGGNFCPNCGADMREGEAE